MSGQNLGGTKSTTWKSESSYISSWVSDCHISIYNCIALVLAPCVPFLLNRWPVCLLTACLGHTLQSPLLPLETWGWVLMCVSPVTHCVRCVQGQAHNGQLTAICVGMLHVLWRGVRRAVILLQVRRLWHAQMFCSGNWGTILHQKTLFDIKVIYNLYAMTI